MPPPSHHHHYHLPLQVRLYIHSDAVLWVAERPHDAALLKPDDPGPHLAAPPPEEAPLEARRAALARVRPLGALWRQLANESAAKLLWGRVELAAAAAALSTLNEVGGRAAAARGDFAAARAASGRNERALAIGASRKFALQSVTMEVTASPAPLQK